jgi:hypothetical protein
MLALLWSIAGRLFWRAIKERIAAARGTQHSVITAAGLLAVELLLA